MFGLAFVSLGAIITAMKMYLFSIKLSLMHGVLSWAGWTHFNSFSWVICSLKETTTQEVKWSHFNFKKPFSEWVYKHIRLDVCLLGMPEWHNTHHSDFTVGWGEKCWHVPFVKSGKHLSLELVKWWEAAQRSTEKEEKGIPNSQQM